jgi:hypothetical protein
MIRRSRSHGLGPPGVVDPRQDLDGLGPTAASVHRPSRFAPHPGSFLGSVCFSLSGVRIMSTDYDEYRL